MTILPLLQAAAAYSKEYSGAWAMHGAGIGAGLAAIGAGLGIGRIGAETCDIEVSVWAKDQTFRPVKRYVVVLNVSLCVTDEHVLKDLLLWIVTQNLALEVSLRWRIWCV